MQSSQESDSTGEPAQVRSDTDASYVILTAGAAGTPLKAWFADISGQHQDDQVLAFQEKCLPCGYFERNNGPCHFVRVLGVRYDAHFQ